MRFCILGPLEVYDGDTSIGIGGPKPRALLAALLVGRGTVVPADRLVDALWVGAPPDGAVSALRAYVSRLRAVLGPQRLTYRAPGYVLTVDDRDEVDAVQFESLVAAAAGTATDADHRSALEALDAALGLWHGDALAEFADLDFARAEAARLDELRVGAVEERLAALQQLGRDAAVVGELEDLVRRFPTREKPVVLLMRALYRSGRQADALAAYHRLRHRLDEELAVEPYEPAQALFRQILLHDTALAPARTRGNLPRRATSFVGRGGEIQRVATALGESPLVTLTGPGGVGKSRLALEAAEKARDRYPDGVWLSELAPLSMGSPVGHTVAAALRIQQRQGLTIEQTLVEYLRPRRLLLVLDNCEHVLATASELVHQLVQECPDVTVLASSREALGLAGEQVWPVAPMEPQEASELFAQRARASRPDFLADQDSAAAIAEICRQLDGLPLAIELAAARIRAMSAQEIARRLDSVRLRGGGARHALPRHQSLSAAIDWSYRLLSRPEQQLFEQLSVFAGGCDLDAAHEVCGPAGTTEDDTLELLTRLVDKSMVTAFSDTGRTRYHVLETLRAFGRDRLEDRGSRMAVVRGHARYYATLAELAAAGLQGRDERAWVERTLPDYDNLRAAFECAVAEQNGELIVRLATSLPELAHLRVGYEASRWAEQTLDLVREEDPRFVAAVGAAARGAWARGDFARARALVARAGARAPRPGTGRIAYPRDVLADVALYEGDVETALLHYELQTRLARSSDEPVRLVWTLYYVAVCHCVRRAPHLGLPAARESLEVAESTANPTALSMAHYANGLVTKKSDPDRALASFDRASRLAASVENFWWYGIAAMEAASTRAVHRDPIAAAGAFLDVLDHWDRVGDWSQQWLNLRYIVRLLVRLGAEEEAVTLHHHLLSAGKASALTSARAALLLDGPAGDATAAAMRRGAGLSAASAISLVRGCLRRLG